MNINMLTKITMGVNVLQEHVYKNKDKKILLLIDENMAEQDSVLEASSIVSNAIIQYVSHEPGVDDVNRIVDDSELIELIELIYTIGGGSTMDLGKAVSVTLTNGKDASQLRGWGKVYKAGLPVVAVPTIPGTSAEFSATAVLKGDGYKLGINSPYVKPIEVVVDPTFFTTLSANVGIPVLLDSYIHSFESLNGKKGSRTSRASCQNVIDIFSELFADGYNNQNIEWNQLSYYANYISSFSLLEGSVGAVHALSYGLSDSMGTCHSKANLAALLHLNEFFGKYSEKAFLFCSQNNVDFNIKATGIFNEDECFNVMVETRDRLHFLWANTIGAHYTPSMANSYILKAIEAIEK